MVNTPRSLRHTHPRRQPVAPGCYTHYRIYSAVFHDELASTVGDDSTAVYKVAIARNFTSLHGDAALVLTRPRRCSTYPQP
jgi:hypothetical protein